MYYLIDYDSLDIVCQHVSKKILKAYINANNLTLATEIVGTAKDVANYLTKQEIMTMYENITLEGLSVTHSEPEMGEMLLIAIADETYPEPTGKAAPPTEEAVKPDPKPKPQTTKPATPNKSHVINTKALQNSTIGLGSEPPVKRIHKQICEALKDHPVTYTQLMDDLVFELDKTEKLLKGYVTDGIRKDILTMGNPDEL